MSKLIRHETIRVAAGGGEIGKISSETFKFIDASESVPIKVKFARLGHKDRKTALGESGYAGSRSRKLGFEGCGEILQLDNRRLVPSGQYAYFLVDDLHLEQQASLQTVALIPEAQTLSIEPDHQEALLKLGSPWLTAGFLESLIRNEFHGEEIVVAILGTNTLTGHFLSEILRKNRDIKVRDFEFRRNADLDVSPIFGRSEIDLLPGRWDVAVDLVGGPVMRAALRFMKNGGRYFSAGNTLGNEASVHLSAFFVKSVQVTGVNLQSALAQGAWHPSLTERVTSQTSTFEETPTFANKDEVWSYLAGTHSHQPRQAIVDVVSFFAEGGK